MKKCLKSRFIYVPIIVWMALIVMIQPYETDAASFKTKAPAAMIVDVDTGKILYAKNADEQLPPASMSKMMTEYLVLEKINNGELSWDTTTTISDYAYAVSGNVQFSGVGLKQGKQYTVKELYEAMAINSDNATTIALAELISGSESEYIKLMNKKAKELGMVDFKFVNATGLDNDMLEGKHPKGTKASETNMLTTRAMAQLGYQLITDYPEVLEAASTPTLEFDGQEVRNWNWMIKHDASFLDPYYYEGLDGLKTGSTDTAGHTFTATAKRDGKRLLVVVMKVPTKEERFEETAKLFDYGFEQFAEEEIFPAGYQLADQKSIPVSKGKKDQVEIATKDPIHSLIHADSKEDFTLTYNIDKALLNKDNALDAPLKKGDKVGTVELVFDGSENFGYILEDKKNTSVDLIITEDIEKKNWFSLMLGAIGQFFSTLYDKIVGLF